MKSLKNYKKGKKAAFEMSITTIVILVIALTMLIFGMIFVRKVMCSSMGIMESVTTGTQKEIDNLFSTQAGEIACLGQSPNIQDIYPTGNMQNAYCGFNVERNKAYTITLVEKKPGPGSAITQANLNSWISLAQNHVNANLNDEVVSSIVYMNIPKDAPEGFFSVKLSFKEEGSTNVYERLLQFNIKRVGAVKSAIC